MSASQIPSGAGLAKAVCLVQLAMAAVAATVAALFWGRPQAVAAVYGGLVAIVPTIYFARRVFAAQRGDAAPTAVVGAVFRGEMGKFALTAVMFGLGVKWFAPQFPALLAGYGACLLSYWIVMARAGFGGAAG